MAQYVKLSMPKADAERLHLLVKRSLAVGFVSGEQNDQDTRLATRLRLALEGKTLNALNRHNTPRARGDTAAADEMLRKARRKWS